MQQNLAVANHLYIEKFINRRNPVAQQFTKLIILVRDTGNLQTHQGHYGESG